MPTSPIKNLLYQAGLTLSPSPRGQMSHEVIGRPIGMKSYEDLLKKHHVLGASLLLKASGDTSLVHTSISSPARHVSSESLFRVASITKMATALVVLKLCEEGAFSIDVPVAPLLPDAAQAEALRCITVRQLLSHTSGLRDTQAYENALNNRQTFHDVLRSEGVRSDSNAMAYCNFGFGLLGCLIEHVTGQSVEAVFQQRLFQPLQMEATLDASTLDERRIVPIARVMPYHKGRETTITPLGRNSIAKPDPLRHFGHTAGAMYTNCDSLSKLLQLIANDGAVEGQQVLSGAMIQQMKQQHGYTGPASNPTRRYGLGLVILDRPDISPRKLYGHQGFAYGCVDGAFYADGSDNQVVFLNGGCSEAREGRLGLSNKDLLQWALQKELPAWK